MADYNDFMGSRGSQGDELGSPAKLKPRMSGNNNFGNNRTSYR